MAVPAVPARADAVADLPNRLARWHGDDVAHYFVSRDAWETGRYNLIFDDLVTIAPQSEQRVVQTTRHVPRADTTCKDSDDDFSRLGILPFDFGSLEWAAGLFEAIDDVALGVGHGSGSCGERSGMISEVSAPPLYTCPLQQIDAKRPKEVDMKVVYVSADIMEDA